MSDPQDKGETQSDLSFQSFEITRVEQALTEVPMLFIDGAQNLFAGPNVVRFNLYQDRVLSGTAEAPEKMIERVVSARLVMPMEGFFQLYDWLTPVVNDLRNRKFTSEGNQ